MTANRLAGETSPYLRQHAGNPVDWWPWGGEAFSEARRRDVPVLLSVGYSACHWCHVMAHESFEDPAVAAVVNREVVAVKVDREERPDVDAVYMEAVQATNGSGGWPMTVFLLPDGRPFFAGTYFPRDTFVDLVGRVGEAWRTGRAGLEEDAASLAAAVARGVGPPASSWAAGSDGADGSGPDVGLRAARSLAARLDREWGGFGGPPKFPQPGGLELLMAAWAAGGGDDLLGAATLTLDAMAAGGIYDHVGGGFARYSTDRRWLVPHFEKMLYDNALLLRAYTHAWQATGEPRYRQVAEEVAGWLLSPPVRQAGGGLSSAEDADSEGVEGRYYVWSQREVLDVAGEATAAWYGVTAAGNWEGANVLWRPVGAELRRPPEVEAGRAALAGARAARPRPGLDDKVLTEWNAMAVAALAEAGATLDRPDWVAAAATTAHFLVAELRRADGRWLRSWQEGAGARHLAYAADHAWLVEAFTRLAEATGEAAWVGEARGAADALIELFFDPADASVHTAGRDAEALIASPRDTYDGAVPSTTSTTVAALARLGTLTGDARYRDRAGEVLAAMAPALARAPVAFTALAAASMLLGGGVEVVVSGDRPDLVAAARAPLRPDRVLAWGEAFPSPIWEGRDGATGLAYVCQGYACAAPTGEPARVAELLAPAGASRHAR